MLIFGYDRDAQNREPVRSGSPSPQETNLAKRRAAQQAERKQKQALQKELVLWRIFSDPYVHDQHCSR